MMHNTIFLGMMHRSIKAVCTVLAIFLPCMSAVSLENEFPRYFVVGTKIQKIPDEPISFESYVALIREQEQVYFARSIIHGETRFKIVGATIAAGANFVNRNYLLENAPKWNWFVTSVTGFSSGSVGILDGSPSIVEADIEGWIRNTQGRIGFWIFTVIGELPFQPTDFHESGSRFSNVYGNYSEDFYPWVFLFDHGWMYVFGLNPFDLWLWSPDMGFLWTSEIYYPLIYRQSDNTWLWYFIDTFSETPRETPRSFFNYTTQEWEFHPPVK